MNLERTVGPLSLRAWGLVINLIANGLALYGLSKMLAGEGGELTLGVGLILTFLCLLCLSSPPRSLSK